MDCRKTLGLGLCLLLGTAGCVNQVTPTPAVPPAQASNTSSPAPVQSVPQNAVVTKAADLPMRTPHAKTCVAAADYLAAEANAPELTETARQQKRDQARRSYQQALTIDPHNLPAYLGLASLYVAMKDHDHAMATYQKASQMFPNEARVFFAMGMCYGSLKDFDHAIQALARAVELEPEKGQYVDTLGWMQAWIGRYDDSMKTFRKVHDEGESYYKLALVLDKRGQTEQCRRYLQAALQKDPQLGAAQLLLTRLDNPEANPVQQAAFRESAKPTAPAATPAPPPVMSVAPAAPAPNLPPAAGPAALLPPPPHILIHYENTPAAAPEAGAAAK